MEAVNSGNLIPPLQPDKIFKTGGPLSRLAAMAPSLVFHASIRINAPVARIWEVLTTPALTKRFMFGGEAISDWKVGSPLVWRLEGSKQVLKGTILAIDPGKRLS